MHITEDNQRSSGRREGPRAFFYYAETYYAETYYALHYDPMASIKFWRSASLAGMPHVFGRRFTSIPDRSVSSNKGPTLSVFQGVVP